MKIFNMETNKILTSNLLDIIFDGKNKQYGAYDLRKTYNDRLGKGLLLTASFALVIFAGAAFANKDTAVTPDTWSVHDTELAKVHEKPVPLPPLPPPIKITPVVNQLIFVIPKIVIDTDVAKDMAIAELTEDMAISSVTIKSDIQSLIGYKPIEEVQTKVFESPKARGEDTTFRTVEIDAEFPGGNSEWARYLQKYLNANVPIDNNASAGTYQVIVEFIVSKDGALSDVHAETRHGYGMEEEAIKIIKRGPKWKPALQNGHNVNAYRRQAITFVVEN